MMRSEAERGLALKLLIERGQMSCQYAGAMWGPDAKGPFKWKETDRYAARKFLASFQKAGMSPATMSNYRSRI